MVINFIKFINVVCDIVVGFIYGERWMNDIREVDVV